ncbi:MAG: hypothetical protein QXX64_05560 [Nitrososphaera sp.]|uniref:Uncharacterized protein n=1 Tax=Nitrososphaera gargensis (strain Ga9.2) TaxID=1237085 RepID=K0I7L1_NITGG|nr:hypothetical protein [Candidatus Nitrososphaera gargensis]AFU57236.1 hypothetical protein Ngar_c02880 [Candidatus Nitrososphaera gargensis Ga9.2]
MHNVILAFVLLLLASLLLACNNQAAAAKEQIVLEAASDQGTFTVEIMWTPDDIGSANAFDIRFIEPETGEEIEDMTYDISIYKGGDREVLRSDQTATRQEFTFDEPGSYTIMIDDIDGLGEWVEIPIQVTPEFPAGVLALIVAFGIVVAVIARRNNNSKNLFSQPTN